MSELPGWIKLHRRLWGNPYMKNPGYLAVWVWLLTHASHGGQDGENARHGLFNGHRIALEVGQLLCGSKQISSDTGVPASTVRRHLTRMENEHQIEHQSDNKCSLITIKNWHLYQDSEQQDKQQVSSSRSTEDQQMSTYKEDKNEKNQINIRNDTMSPSETSPTKAERNNINEYKQLLVVASKVFGQKKAFTSAGFEMFRFRRRTYSLERLCNAFENLLNEPGKWKIENNAQRPMKWWLKSDDYIIELENVHTKTDRGRPVVGIIGEDNFKGIFAEVFANASQNAIVVEPQLQAPTPP